MLTHRTRITLVAALALLMLAGCADDPGIHDTIDLEFDFLFTPSTDLHTPYVVGANVSIFATEQDPDDPDHKLWTLESDNEAVFRINEQNEGSASCTAVSAGFATVSIIDGDGEVIGGSEIEVVAPDRAVLFPHGPMIVGRTTPINGSIDVLVDGTASLMVQYFRGDRRLFGNGALSVSSQDGLAAAAETTFLFEDREWVQITPTDIGQHELNLFAGDIALGTITVTGRTADEIESIELMHELTLDLDDEDNHGKQAVVLGMARLANERPVFGVEFSWDLDGDGEPGLGDLFRYNIDLEAESTLGAEFDGMRAETSVAATEGFVDSSNDLGCSTSGKGTSGSWASLMGVALALAASRRRRGRPHPGSSPRS